MKVVVVAKTRMGSGACIGALTFEGQSLRLIAGDRETNDQFNQEYQVGEVWEIEGVADPDIEPPHLENLIVREKRRLAPLTGIEAFIEENMPPITGPIEIIFDGLTQATGAGARYIAAETGIPGRSTMFWRPDRPLIRVEDHKRIRYRYPGEGGSTTLTFVGYQEPLPEIPAGSLIRVSLAHWWRPKEKPKGELRCYVQISGWFLPDRKSILVQSSGIKQGKTSYLNQIEKVDEVLQEVFGYNRFRPLQREIISKILQKEDTLGVMPTGSGKSLCFQLPAVLFQGLTVVVSPLISLMEDQVLELKEIGITADYLNSTLTYDHYLEAVRRIRDGKTRLMYASPETLLRSETILLLESCLVDCLVIDEAHCISEWGHEFRPEYRQLASLRDRLPEAVTLAITATATKRVRKDITHSLNIPKANVFVSSFNRKNLVLSVVDKTSGLAQTRAFLDDHKDMSGIIYCATRNQVDKLTQQLSEFGIKVLPYHAGMEDGDRRQNQHRFRYEEGIIIVATIAFGMGINKSNVRFILHYDLPKNLESYYQQIGRAGRDGLPADCLTLFSYGDVKTIEFFIQQEDPKLQLGSKRRLHALLNFVGEEKCRRIPLLRYFGEVYKDENCGACDNCINQDEYRLRVPQEEEAKIEGAVVEGHNLSEPARWFLNCVLETRQIFGSSHLIGVLRGSKAKKVLKFKHDQLDCYGMGRSYSKEAWQHIIAQFIRKGLVKRVKPHGSLVITEMGRAVLDGKEVWGDPPTALSRAASLKKADYDQALFNLLRDLRFNLAKERQLPPYVIFHDSTLTEMATYMPITEEGLLSIFGVGHHKASVYGPQFLAVIRKYCQEHNISSEKNNRGRLRGQGLSTKRNRMDYIYKCYQAGARIEEIATEMGLTIGTILRYLDGAFAEGLPLQIDSLVEMSTLSEDEKMKVISSFDEFGVNRLKPTFDALGGKVKYDELHIWRLIFKISHQKD